MTKKYTLYFKGKNKEKKEFDYPIISLSLKDMDLYTSCYKDSMDFFNNLPSEVKDFITQELSYEINLDKASSLNDRLYIMDEENKTVIDIIFNYDIDALYANEEELEDAILNKLMTFDEYQKSLLKTNVSLELKQKLDFFARLYNKFVKNNKIECMIDDYDIKRRIVNYKKDDVLTAAIATDKDNLLMLSKKLFQTSEKRRMLAMEYKKAFKEKLISNEKINSRKNEISLNLINLGCKESLKNYMSNYK